MSSRRHPLYPDCRAQHIDGRYCRVLELVEDAAVPLARVRWEGLGVEELLAQGYLSLAGADTGLSDV